MARSWHYPRWRRHVMQAALWLVLAATLATAALVNQRQRRQMRVELGPPVTYGSLIVRLPRDWQPLANDPDERVVVRAVEPGEGGGRVVSLSRYPLRSLVSPLEHLIRISASRGIELLVTEDNSPTPTEPIVLDGWAGVLVQARAAAPQPSAIRGVERFRKEMYACAVVPSGHAIVIRLESADPTDAADLALLRSLAEHLRIGDQPALAGAGDTVALADGIRVACPPGLAPVIETDPLRLERRLWCVADAPLPWTTVSLTPCLLVSDESDEQAIRTLLATHDPRLRGANIVSDGPRSWRIEPVSAPAESIFPPRLHLLADERADGTISAGPRRAVLAALRGGPFAEARYDELWQQISAGVRFTGDPQFAAMFAAGAEQVRRVSARPLASLLPAQGERWWLWYDAQARNYPGWTHSKWSDEDQLGGTRTTRWRGREGGLLRLDEEWTGDLARYRCLSESAQAAAPVAGQTAASPELSRTVRHVVALEDGQLRVELYSAAAFNPLWTRPAPPQFVPGGWLPMILGRMCGDEPVALRTDSFVGLPGDSPLDPITVLIRPTDDASRATADGPPLRELLVHVNGLTELSRWLVRPDDTVETVELAGGVQRLAKDEQTIEIIFRGDLALTPRP